MFNKIAQKAGVSLKSVELAEKETGNLLSRLISEVFSQTFSPKQVQGVDLTEEKYLDCVRYVMKELAAKGNVVIVGVGAQYILPKRQDIIKVLLVAEQEHRVTFIMEHFGLDREKAQQVVQREERKRANYLKAFGPGNPDDPSIYNLVINTGHVSLKVAEDLIVCLVEQVRK
jgi:cytidylate kinase